MPTKFDPTRTTTLRRQFMSEMRRRIYAVRRLVNDVVGKNDAFGFANNPLANVEPADYVFRTNPDKLKGFQEWFKEQVDRDILSVNVPGDPWTAKYVDSAYRQGTTRAFVDTRKAAMQDNPDFFAGTKEEFLRSAFSQPERLQKIQLLATRAFEELKGVTATMAKEMNRTLADGLANGRNPRQIAREMSKRITQLSKTRAMTIARTEVIHAHAEGQLDSFKDLGVEELGVIAEWSTAGDDRVCQRCVELEGQTFSVEQARGTIPLHPNCRCAWIPTTKEQIARERKNVMEAALGGPLQPELATDAQIATAFELTEKQAAKLVKHAKQTAATITGDVVSHTEIRGYLGRFIGRAKEVGGKSATRLEAAKVAMIERIQASQAFQVMDSWYRADNVAGMLLRGTGSVSKTVGRAYMKTINAGLNIAGAGLPPAVRAAGYVVGLGTSYALTPVMPWLAIPGASDAFAIGSLLGVQVPFRAYQAARWIGRRVPVGKLGRLVKGTIVPRSAAVEVSAVARKNLTAAVERLAYNAQPMTGTPSHMLRMIRQSEIEALQNRAATIAARSETHVEVMQRLLAEGADDSRILEVFRRRYPKELDDRLLRRRISGVKTDAKRKGVPKLEDLEKKGKPPLSKKSDPKPVKKEPVSTPSPSKPIDKELLVKEGETKTEAARRLLESGATDKEIVDVVAKGVKSKKFRKAASKKVKKMRKRLKIEAPLEQRRAEYFRDAVLKDSDGNPITFFHASRSKENVDDFSNKGFGQGMFFSKERARVVEFGKHELRGNLAMRNPYFGTTADIEDVAQFIPEKEMLRMIDEITLGDKVLPDEDLIEVFIDVMEDKVDSWQDLEFIKALRKSDFDGVVSQDPFGGSTEYFILDPSQLRVIEQIDHG